jgi:hypothetical protein
MLRKDGIRSAISAAVAGIYPFAQYLIAAHLVAPPMLYYNIDGTLTAALADMGRRVEIATGSIGGSRMTNGVLPAVGGLVAHLV